MKIFAQDIATGDDIFAVRQRARRLAQLVGFDESDQVRVATALSEVARDVIGDHRGSGTVSFTVDGEPQAFVIVVDDLRATVEGTDVGLSSARRLMPHVEQHAHPGGRRLVMSRPLPHALSVAQVAELGDMIAQQAIGSPLDELRTQNRELVATLDALTTRQQQLVALNSELEETNRGVMAMYTELSDELESTNRGVVALYAELDDASLLLRQASEAKTRFLANVSHELRSPVSAIIGLSRLLLDDGVARQREVELINTSANELLILVSELLDLAKAESGRLTANIEVVDVGRVVADLGDTLRPLASDGVDLIVNVSEARLQIDADATLLRHAIRNLIVNALAFTTRGQVVVTAEPTTNGVDIAVTDTGIGIAQEHLDRIFEEFFQVRGPLQTGRKGTGLGLAYSRAVVAEHGGTIAVSSIPGAGSTFTIHLASAAAHDGDAAGGAVSPGAENGSGR